MQFERREKSPADAHFRGCVAPIPAAMSVEAAAAAAGGGSKCSRGLREASRGAAVGGRLGGWVGGRVGGPVGGAPGGGSQGGAGGSAEGRQGRLRSQPGRDESMKLGRRAEGVAEESGSRVTARAHKRTCLAN
jgi:hypothetical protein